MVLSGDDYGSHGKIIVERVAWWLDEGALRTLLVRGILQEEWSHACLLVWLS